MLINRRLTMLFNFALVLALVLAGCAPVVPQGAASDVPLIVLIDNDEGPLTPANYNTAIGLWMLGWVYDPLFAKSPDLSAIPALATEATMSDDGLAWTIQLREGVKWHDGEDFTVEDVIFSYNFLSEAGWAAALGAVESMTADGDYSLTIQLSTPQPFLMDEALAVYSIIPEHVWRDQVPVSGEITPFDGRIGTGAYRLSEIVPGESYTFQANPDYYRGAPKIQTIIAKIVKDRTQQFSQLQTGDASAVLPSIPPTLVDQVAGNDNIRILTGPDFYSYVFYVNGSRAPFDNPDVRKAISAAIDVQELVDTVLLGRGTALPASWRHPEIPGALNLPHTYDPALSKTLLEGAGLLDSNGDGTREWNGAPTDFAINCDVNNPVEVRATELIAGWLLEVGIGSHQNCVDIDTAVSFIWPSFTAVAEPDYDMSIWGWSAVPQTRQGFVRFMVDGDLENFGWANLTGTSDAELDALLAEFVSTVEPTRRGELNEQLQERFAEAMPFIPLMSPSGNFAVRPGTYDGWVYTLGIGIVPVWSFLPEDASTK